MKFYLYDEKTKEYTGTQNAFIDPLETKAQGKNVYLVPPFSTTEKPNLTSLKDNEILVFNGNKWQVEQEFYVGKIVGCHGERVSKYVTDNDLTLEKCDEGFKIVEKPAPKEKTLDELKEEKHQELRYERDKLRHVEFAVYNDANYQIRQEDQDNMNTFLANAIGMLSGIMPRESFSIMDADNIPRTLTPEQIIELGRAMKTKVEEIYARYWHARDVLLVNAQTKEEIQSITILSN